MITQGMHWTAQQVKQLKRLATRSQSGEKPVFVTDWPGPSPSSGPRPTHRWMRFIDLPVIESVGDGLFSVSFTMEPIATPKPSRAGSRKRKSGLVR